MALHRHSNALVDVLPPEADSTISVMSQTERPDVTYQVRSPGRVHALQVAVWLWAARARSQAERPHATHQARQAWLPSVLCIGVGCRAARGCPSARRARESGGGGWAPLLNAWPLPARPQDIGGMDIQKQEIKEAVELPLVQARAVLGC